MRRLDVYRCDDGRWNWRLTGLCGRTLAFGGDCFNDRAAAVLAARQVLAGSFEVVVDDHAALIGAASATNVNGHGHLG